MTAPNELRHQTVSGAAQVTSVYPSGDVLPENTLRFYLHFSVPMAPHRSSEFIVLRDASGAVDRAAFMWFKQELWNRDRTRLTLLIDPGRIKRGVATHEKLGPALREGERYSLVIDAGWPAADGRSDLASFSKTFRVGPPLRERPGADRWQWVPPRPGTIESLEVRFDRPFDRHLLDSALAVASSDGRLIDGVGTVGEHERAWSFVPDEPWPADSIELVPHHVLEDVAGNNLHELLDNPIHQTRNSLERRR